MTSAPPPGPARLDPVSDGSVTSPRGFAAAAVHAGLKADGALDVALLVSATSCATAGVFTRNAVRAAPVVYDAELLAERPGRIRAVPMADPGLRPLYGQQRDLLTCHPRSSSVC